MKIISEKGDSTDIAITENDGTPISGITKISLHPITCEPNPIIADLEFEFLELDIRVEPHTSLEMVKQLADQHGYDLVERTDATQ